MQQHEKKIRISTKNDRKVLLQNHINGMLMLAEKQDIQDTLDEFFIVWAETSICTTANTKEEIIFPINVFVDLQKIIRLMQEDEPVIQNAYRDEAQN